MKKHRNVLLVLISAVIVPLILTGCNEEKEHPSGEQSSSEHPTSEKGTSEHPASEHPNK